MRRSFFAIIIALGMTHAGYAQLSQTGAGNGTAVSYVGPGDIVSGASGWWGLRAYSTAQALAHAKAVRLCSAISCLTREDETVASNGSLTLGSVGSACDNGVNQCYADTLYDQSGNAHDLSSVLAERVAFKINCIGSKPCLLFVKASNTCFHAAVSTVNQPLTYSWVAQRTGNFTAQQGIFTSFSSGNSPADFFTTSTNQIWMFAGTVRAVTAADSTWHDEQSVYNNATTPGAILDGTATTLAGSPGATNGSGSFAMGCNTTGSGAAVPLDGLMTEGGVWPVAFNTTQGSSMHTNQKNYWGY